MYIYIYIYIYPGKGPGGPKGSRTFREKRFTVLLGTLFCVPRSTSSGGLLAPSLVGFWVFWALLRRLLAGFLVVQGDALSVIFESFIFEGCP